MELVVSVQRFLRRLTADWLAPRESDFSRIRSKVSSEWLPSYIEATRPVLEIFKMVGYFQEWPRRVIDVCAIIMFLVITLTDYKGYAVNSGVRDCAVGWDATLKAIRSRDFFFIDIQWPATSLGCITPQAVTHSLVLLKMGKIISRNMLSWLELLISRYCCI